MYIGNADTGISLIVSLMKKITFMLIGAVLGVVSAAAQDCEVQPIEGGFYAGPTFSVGGYHGGKSKCCASLGLNLNYNIPHTPIDCGVFFQMDFPRRDIMQWTPIHDDEGQEIGQWGSSWSQINRTVSFGVIGHYNFRQCSAINPFAGLGIGVGFNESVADVIYYTKGTSAVVMPQIGVEFWHLFRLTGYAMVCRKGYNCAGITLGFSFGGRPRRQ